MVKKVVPKEIKVSNGGFKSHLDGSKLTSREKQVLDLLIKDFLTSKQICKRLNISVQRVNHYIRSLRKKGLLKSGVSKNVTTLKPFVSDGIIRLHGEHWRLGIICGSDKFDSLFKQSNFLVVDSNTVKLSRGSVNVYSGQHFVGDSVELVTRDSMEYWSRFFVRLEYQLGLSLLKSRYENVKRVSAHYARVKDEIAEELEKEGDRIKIFNEDDGKLWFVCDNSFNLHESETVHPETSDVDMSDVVVPWLQDLKSQRTLLPSQLSDLVLESRNLIKNLSVTHLDPLTTITNEIKSSGDIVHVFKKYEVQIKGFSDLQKKFLESFIFDLREGELYGRY